MKAHEALIERMPSTWSRATAGQLHIQHYVLPPEPCEYALDHGGESASRHKLRDAANVNMFVDRHTVVVRDRIAPAIAHEPFLAIDDYALTISPDFSGARDVE